MENDAPALSLQPFSERPTLNQCISLWLATKTKRSEQTKRAYTTVIAQFRAALQATGRDLNSDATIVALIAQEWAGVGADGRAVSASTFDQRLAILSSFFKFAVIWSVCMSNPIDLIEREPRENPDAAVAMEAPEIAEYLKAIDRSTPEGLRDFALLTVGVTTGRRVNELAAMRWKDIAITRTTITVTWPHCKGNKIKRDALAPKTAQSLMAYLRSIYGEHLEQIRAESPIWVSFSNNNRYGAISDQTIANICKDRIGTSKVHTLRHSFTVSMDDAGAPITEISERLGHADIKTTSIYLKRLRSAKNPYGSKLEEMFGIE